MKATVSAEIGAEIRSTDRHAGEYQSELARREVELTLDGRNTCGPAADEEAGAREDDRERDSCLAIGDHESEATCTARPLWWVAARRRQPAADYIFSGASTPIRSRQRAITERVVWQRPSRKDSAREPITRRWW